MEKELEKASHLTVEELFELQVVRHKKLDEKNNAKVNAEIEKYIDNPILGIKSTWPFFVRPSNISLYFIIPNEFAERFCFYGFHAILKNLAGRGLGLTTYSYGEDGKLDGNSDTSAALSLKFTFDTVVYFFPLIGAAVSDSFLGKYWTVCCFGLLYMAGLFLLYAATNPAIWGFDYVIAPILSAYPNSTAASLVPFIPNPSDVGKTGMPYFPVILALGLIALGTGGIKPCISSHGGDQFLPQQNLGLNQFFSFFYIAINVGALISGFVVPEIQAGSCHGFMLDCYSEAFLVCALVFLLSYVVFAVGKPFYRIVPPAGRFIIWDILKAWTHSLFIGRKKAVEIYGHSLMTEVSDLGKVLVFILPTPIFWMGFNQNGTTWQDSTDRMGERIFDSTQINSVINPLFIALLSPLFSVIIYPRLPKFSLIWRLVSGYLFAAVAYLICGFIDMYMLANCTVDQTLATEDRFFNICQYQAIDNTIYAIPIFIITVAEVLVSISGLNFVYEEVGPRTKSSSSALWLMTSAFGSLFANYLAKYLTPGTFAGPKHLVSYDKFYFICSGILVVGAVLQYLVARIYVAKKDRPVE